MKRSLFTALLTVVLTLTTASQASACLCIPYIPWLDPFAWLGFYGCGGGCGWGYGGGCYGGGYGCDYGYGAAGYGAYPGYGYAPPVVPNYGYAARQPVMNYASRVPQYAPVAQVPQYLPMQQMAQAGCDCTGGANTGYQMPVTGYQPVTNYVPQTAYQPQFQSAYAAPGYGTMTYGTQAPTTVYGGAMPYSPGVTYGTPTYSTPTIQMAPSVASPYGDIGTDQQFPTQSANIPVIPNSHVGQVPIRPASYGVPQGSARRFSAAVR
ncbi:MAG: hypothetical protein R3C59_15215 [Planctomycetaceae bacterium]